MKRRLFLFIIFLVGCNFAVMAHPHLFFTSDVDFVWEEKELKECRFEWTFDQMFSADVLRYDYDNDGVFNKQETLDVYNNAFIYLSNYYYFIFIRDGAERSNPAKVYDFSVIKKGNSVAYRFAIELPKNLTKAGKGSLSLAVYDYTFFCSIEYQRDNIRLLYDPNYVKADFTLTENKNYPVYYNPYGSATDTTVYYEWKKGLEKFYPIEINVNYE